MLNYIKMDLFKLFKSRYFYICMFVFLIFLGLDLRELKVEEDEVLFAKVEETISEDEVLQEDFYSMGLGFDGIGMAYRNNLNLKNLVNATYAGNEILLFAFIILSIFVCNDFGTGYIKNTITVPAHRWYANLSKLVVAAVIMIVQNIIILPVEWILIRFYYKTAVVGDLNHMFCYLLTEFVLYLALATLIILLCNITKSKAAMIVISIFVSAKMAGQVISKIGNFLFGIPIENMCKKIIAFVFSDLRVDMSGRQLKSNMMFGGVMICIYLLSAWIVLERSDY